MHYSYLALGDSYTIGEQVPFAENFPNQTVQLLRDADLPFHAAEIIAKTGWTTDELNDAVTKTVFLKQYDFVTLLVGVNNQYRGISVEEFQVEFENLLQVAIKFANDSPYRVFVLSIPDWGVTPFADEAVKTKVAAQIDDYNKTCKELSSKYKTHYLDITTGQRITGSDADSLAPDNLHPSGKEYGKWAALLFEGIKNELA